MRGRDGDSHRTTHRVAATRGWLADKMVFIFFKTVFLFFMALPCLVCAADYAATNIRVVNARWPDAGSPESFGRDAIRLTGAESEEEQATAVWRFIQQMTEVGTVPKEPAYGNSYVLSPEKLLNVYGVHWCDGLSRIMTMTWRALGYRADKLYRFGHTLADIHYRDKDGIDRWHIFDLSQHWYVYDRTGKHIATREELALDHSLLYYPSRTPIPSEPSPMQPGWVHAGHLNLKPHSMGINLWLGETIEFLFGNEGKPYLNLFPAGERRDFEHGPYPLTYGNGRLLSRPQWEDSFAEKILDVEIPYVISAAFLNFSGRVEQPDGYFRVSLSTDGGASWKSLWQTEKGREGDFQLEQMDYCPTFNPRTTKRVEEITPFGRYDYKLKVEMAGCRLDDFEVTTVFQHNIFALPMLWPGENRISVNGSTAPGTALKVSYLWDDARGQDHRHEGNLTSLPAQYVIKSDGLAWKDVRTRRLRIEALEMSDVFNNVDGTRSEAAASASRELPYPTERSIGSKSGRQPDFDRDKAELAEALRKREPSVIADRIVALGALRDPRGAFILEKVIMDDATSPAWHKILACQALYQSVGSAAAPVLMKVLERDPTIAWKKPSGKWTSDTMWLHTAAAATALLADIQALPERERAAELIAETLKGSRTKKPLAQIYRGSEIGWGLIRALGFLGSDRHVPLLKGFLANKSDETAVAAEALIRIGNSAVLPEFLNLLQEAQYPPVRTAAIKGIGRFGESQHAVVLQPFLNHWDEDFRAATAVALANLDNAESISALQEALQDESFSWVKDLMQDSLDSLVKKELSSEARPAVSGRFKND